MTRHWFGKPLKTLVGGIRLRLIGMIMLVVVPLVAARAIELGQERFAQIDAAGAQAIEIAQRGAELYKEPIVAAQTLLEVASHVPAVVTGSAESCASFLAEVGRNRGWASSFWVIGPDGRAVCTTTPGGIGLDVSDREYFRRAVATRQFVVSDFYHGRLTGEPASMAALPVLGPDGSVTRVLGIKLRLSWFSQLAAEIGMTSDASVLLVDGNGALLARFPEQPERIGSNFGGPDLMHRVLAAREGRAEITSIDGQQRLYGFVQIPGTQARIAVGFDRAQVLARVDGEIAKAAIALMVAMVLAIVASIVLAGGIARPLKILTAGAEAARRCERAELPEISGYAEVESLAASLKALLAERRRREQALGDARMSAEQAERSAREARDRLTGAIEMLPEGVAIFDAEDRLVLWNKRYEELYPQTADIRRPGIKFHDMVRIGIARGGCPDAVGREEEWLAERFARHAEPRSSHERSSLGDRFLRVEERRTADGGTIGIQIDITGLKRREASFRLLFDSNPIPMWVYDRDELRFLAVNDAAVAHYGYSREQFLAMTLLDIRPCEEREIFRDALLVGSLARGDRVWSHLKGDGSAIEVTVYSTKLRYEGRPAALAAVIDVTERRRAEARITHMAHHDGLTGLANRTLFRERLEAALARGDRRHGGLAVHCIDLDYFKNVNDTLGHPIGDALLRQVADRLRACTREFDTVARIGGDEFAIIQDAMEHAEDAGRVAGRVIEVLGAPYCVDGHELVVAASMGIAVAPAGERDPDRLLKNADVALYRAKSDGRRNFRYFEPEMDARLQARRTLELDLRAALSRAELELYYQPSIDLKSGDVKGFEALLRWNHPERGLVSPAEFIPVAEEIGLIVPLGEWVLRAACAEAVNWPQDLAVAVNLSPLQFRSGNLVAVVAAALAATGLPARRLELEITESVLFQDNDVNLATLHQLHDLGATIAMDDFGTGYSSLSYLRRFPFDRIKIDRSFVGELAQSFDCLTITRGIVGLAAGLGMKTTAEGVETVEQLDLLRAHGCTEAQGFLFGHATPAAEARAFLAKHRRKIGNAA